MNATMGWLDGMFTSRKTRQVDVAMTIVRKASEEQEAATNRLELTIQGVIDAKTGHSRNANSSSNMGRN